MISEWALSRIEPVKDQDFVVIQDSLGLLSENDGGVHTFAKNNGFTVIIASTNLVFRELYEKAVADPETKKLLFIDRAPASRRKFLTTRKAPPPFYPDVMVRTSKDAIIALDLRQYLTEQTGDPRWPQIANSPRYAKIIARNIGSVLQAHQNLRTADPTRFTDNDFQRIVAYAALDVADYAFKSMDAEYYWKIGLLGHETLENLESLAAEITRPIKDELQKAPAPFCWFSKYDTETVLRSFYLSLILSQHFDHWKLLLANVDPTLSSLNSISHEILVNSAPKLIAMNNHQAQLDIETVEASLSAESIEMLFLNQMDVKEFDVFSSLLRKEQYSGLFRSIALFAALRDLLTGIHPTDKHQALYDYLTSGTSEDSKAFLDSSSLKDWLNLKEAYRLAFDILDIKRSLDQSVKTLNVIPVEKQTTDLFIESWNQDRINRLEYYLSSLERLLDSGELLPRAIQELPAFFTATRDEIIRHAQETGKQIFDQLDHYNQSFQIFFAHNYPHWIKKDSQVRFTSQFLRRCLKSHWDPQTEKAIVFVFDGMRYDIWDELLRPLIEDQVEILADYCAFSILPSETHITRKAIAACSYPDSFNTNAGEDQLLEEGLESVFGFKIKVEVVSPHTKGMGETVRYQAGNLDYIIFELCDKELHRIKYKTLPDGRETPTRSLSFIYKQLIKNVIDTEFMAIFRNLSPGTKVFVVADHGFGNVGRNKIWFDIQSYNDASDCSYLNCRLRVPIEKSGVPAHVLKNVISFTPEQLRMPLKKRLKTKSGTTITKEYSTIAFPKTKYAFSRPGSPFKPDAYSHGGISIQQLLIPMVAMKIKDPAGSVLYLGAVTGPNELVEGEEFELHIPVRFVAELKAGSEIRVEMEAYYGELETIENLPNKVLYISNKESTVNFMFKPDTASATKEERRSGILNRAFTIKASCRFGGRTYQRIQQYNFTVKLNSEQIVRRVPSHLGNILGLTPKSMR